MKTLLGVAGIQFHFSEYDAAALTVLSALEIAEKIGDRPEQAFALQGLGLIRANAGDYGGARTYLEQAVALYSELGIQTGKPIINLAMLERDSMNLDRAEELLELGMVAAAAQGNCNDLISCHNVLASVASRRSQFDRACSLFKKALDINRECRDLFAEVESLNGLGECLIELSEFDQAREALEQASSLSVRIGNPRGHGRAQGSLGQLARVLRHFDTARDRLKEGIRILHAIPDPYNAAETIVQLGLLESDLGRYERAVRLWRPLELLCEQAGTTYPSIYISHERRAAAREALGAQTFDDIWRDTGSLSLDQAVEYALSLPL
jgi:tetratricopeptide (TPR) repeat protein